MRIADVYANIQSQLDKELPFVLYRKSEESTIYSMLQEDDCLYEINSYTDSGFIFSPFDTTEKAIIIPVDHSRMNKAAYTREPSYSLDIEKLKDAVSFDTDTKGRKEHKELVTKGIDFIKTGVCKKIVLSRREEVDFSTKNPIQVFRKLVDNYPNAFVYCWYHPKVGMWLGATPETLAKIQGNTFSTMALAGTQVYKGTIDVTWGTKELKEQMMVTEFVLQGLSSVTNQINHSKTYTHKAGTLLHLRTDIEAVLDENSKGIQDIIQLIHPTPAVCGLPKKEAKLFILDNEGYNRKYYTGYLGELNMEFHGTSVSNLFVNLRCMEIVADTAILYVGGGITKDSDPEKEWIETIRKTETMKKVLQ